VPAISVTIDRIDISPFNVRTHRGDIEDTAALEASIREEGLLNPIAVHPIGDDEGAPRYGAVAGGRRTRAIRNLIARGELPANWPVRVFVHGGLSEAELIEISITENLQRRDLRDYELCAGVARAADGGHDLDTIARALAQPDPGRVAQWLRLGRLAPPVFKAFASGLLSLDRARAYAATEDPALQAAVFERLSTGHESAHTPLAIRTALKVGDATLARQLAFVGEATYRDAGGRWELDLFAEEADHRGRVVDEALLARLVETELARVRDDVRVSCEDRDLRFIPEKPRTDFDLVDYALEVRPGREGERITLPKGDIVAHIELDREGRPEISFWWASRKAKFAQGGSQTPVSLGPIARAMPIADQAALRDRDRIGGARTADAALKDDMGLSQDGVQLMRSQRREILRAMLVRNAEERGTVGRDYLVWSQLRMLAGADTTLFTGMNRLSTETIGGFDLAARAKRLIALSGVREPVEAALAELAGQSSFTGGDPAEAFADFCASPDRLKNLAAALVAGFALERSLNADGYRIPAHDAVAHATRLAGESEIRQYWSPTEALLDLFAKSARIGFAATVAGDAVTTDWAPLKSADVSIRAAEVLSNSHWLPDILAFRPPEPPADPHEAATPEPVDQLEDVA
jgi:ParB family transcriptional regulator, chromosome partitioning protein